MSKLEELIERLCPNGVEFKQLWEVTVWDKKFNNVDKFKQLKINNFTHVSAFILKNLNSKTGNVRLLSTGNFEGLANKDDVEDYCNFGEVITIPTGGSANIKYHKGYFVDSGNLIATTSDPKKYDIKFVYYFLVDINDVIQSFFRGSGVKHPDMTEILNIKLPIPPLEIQQEIVRILDTFTSLEAELEAELEARKKQYEFYRNQLLKNDNVPMVLIEEICAQIVVGGDLPEKYKKGQKEPSLEFPYPIYSNGTEEAALYGYTNDYRVEKMSITISARGTIGYHTIRSGKFTPIVRLISLIADESKVKTKYLNYALFTTVIEGVNTGIPSLTAPMLKKLKIPLPSLSEQDRIVAVLDKFDIIVNDLFHGLPAEIAARRMQYEYYRNKLLTFKDLSL